MNLLAEFYILLCKIMELFNCHDGLALSSKGRLDDSIESPLYKNIANTQQRWMKYWHRAIIHHSDHLLQKSVLLAGTDIEANFVTLRLSNFRKEQETHDQEWKGI